AIRRRIEAGYLHKCEHLTAASPGIAHAYHVRYGVRMTPILNVFPLMEAPRDLAAHRTCDKDRALSLYWFSQTVGPGRVLETFIYLLAGIPILLSDTPAQRELARELGSAARLVDLNKADEIAETLNNLAKDGPSLAAAKREAWRLGRTCFNWDIEKERFLQSV